MLHVSVLEYLPVRIDVRWIDNLVPVKGGVAPEDAFCGVKLSSGRGLSAV